MKRPKSDRQSEHVLGIVKRLVALPMAFAVAAFRWLKKTVQSGRSPKEVHAADEARQSQVRRTLRGLPPDHVQPPAANP